MKPLSHLAISASFITALTYSSAVAQDHMPALTNGQIVVSGHVPDEATKASLIAKLREVYGASMVVDQVNVGGVVAPPNWTAHVSTLLTPQIKSISKGQLAIEGTTVSLRGEVATEATRQAVASGIASALHPAYVVKDGLRVTAASQDVIDQVLSNRIVEFEPGSALITPAGKLVLEDVFVALQKTGKRKFEVIGHTDNTGSSSHNLALSRARAESVKTHLIAKGIFQA